MGSKGLKERLKVGPMVTDDRRLIKVVLDAVDGTKVETNPDNQSPVGRVDGDGCPGGRDLKRGYS